MWYTVVGYAGLVAATSVVSFAALAFGAGAGAKATRGEGVA